jgi:hypothetical protein
MSAWRKIRTRWLKALIAYHRGKSEAYARPVIGSWKRDGYNIWLRAESLRHAIKANELQEKLALAGKSD